MRIIKKTISLLLALSVFLVSAPSSLGATSNDALHTAIEDAAAYVYNAVKKPQVGSVGGEWAVIGLARSNYAVPEKYYKDYYSTVVKYVKDSNGILHNRKYTEYSRVTLALTAIGKDPRNVSGYNLLTPLGDYDKTIWQGLNGPIWALIALDSGNYAMPQNAAAQVQATRDMYVQRILDCQLSDGGWALSADTESESFSKQLSEPDITGMALQALSNYQDREDVQKSIAKALICISQKQDDTGGYSSWGKANIESIVQIVVALAALDIELDDARFDKNGVTLLDNLMKFYSPGKGFQHAVGGGGSGQMATEQGLYSLIAVLRLQEGKPSLYQMSDALKLSADTGAESGMGLSCKHPDVLPVPIASPGTTFLDIIYSEERTAIEALAARGIIKGKTDTAFDPNATMTRAEFSAIIVRGLSLMPKANDTFHDVYPDKWYAAYIGSANTYGIVNGITPTSFHPMGTITRQEAAVMITRAAKLCGMDISMGEVAVRDMLSQFGDYVLSSDWARASLAFCYSENILPQTALTIRPLEPIKRNEVAQILFNLLSEADLL